MKDSSQQALEEGRPAITGLHGVESCLARLYADETKCTSEEIVGSLTFGELIGALLVARDELVFKYFVRFS
jgi:hypothetical protein